MFKVCTSTSKNNLCWNVCFEFSFCLWQCLSSLGRKNEKIVPLFVQSFAFEKRRKEWIGLVAIISVSPPPAFSFFSFFFKRGQKKIHLPATFRKQNLLFFVPRISLFSAGCTRPSDALLRYSIVDVLNNTNKKKKESKKGPRKRERESLGESYVVHRHHRHPFTSSRAKKKKSIYLNLR